MGQESIKTLNQENYYDAFKKTLLTEADKEQLYNKFKLGVGSDIERRRHAQMFYDILCTDNCEIIDWVWDKIEGKLEGQDCKKDLNCLKECTSECSVDELFDECCTWEEINW